MNGGVGTLNACHVAIQMIRAGRTDNALILAAEIENNAALGPEHLVGLRETGSALVLAPSSGREGFGRFVFRADPAHSDERVAHTIMHQGAAALRHEQAPGYEGHLIAAVGAAVAELLKLEGLALDAVTRVFPPHRSGAFVAALARALGLPLERFALLPDEDRDYSTSSLAATLEAAREAALVGPGDIGLLIAAGSGIYAGCALYYF
jgi:3-oxoacyl-[acyl-carrier-protein] synthase III